MEEGDAAAALAGVELFLKARPSHPGALRLRGAALARLGRPLEAAESLREASAAARGAGRAGPEMYLARAEALEAAGKEHLPEALSWLEEGIALLGSPPSMLLAAAALEERLGQIDAAVARLDAEARRSRHPERWRARQGEILERSGRTEAARRAYEEALRSLASLPPSRRTRARAELEAQARAALQRLQPPRQDEAQPEAAP